MTNLQIGTRDFCDSIISYQQIILYVFELHNKRTVRFLPRCQVWTPFSFLQGLLNYAVNIRVCSIGR
jgi:hypothetical protein